ncbi:hypothetical protein EU520_00815 [Candidatus Thorarchaeota archaeon]|nr:MAG: hypothetical protein EU520_00815 [Candidatus Thorarchaeota archaeon]
MRTYLVLFDSLPIDRKKIRAGRNPAALVTACRCVNVALFVSRDLRRDVEISLGLCEDNGVSLITFPGDTLKRVSPDERSISFFIMKAREKLDRIELGDVAILDNGIGVEKRMTEGLLDSLSYRGIYVADESANVMPDQITLKQEGVFVYPVSDCTSFSLHAESMIRLHRPHHPERFINDLNRAFDYS